MEPEIEIEEIEEVEQDNVQEEDQDNQQNYKQGKGWRRWLGSIVRKATIVGATAVAALVVIPSAIFMSTLGGALCVPFGLYLGTVALTDKFMNYLLPQVEVVEEPRAERHVWFKVESDEDHETYSEEEIWQEIDLIRALIGYKAPLHTSCLEELQAIFIFMGIEYHHDSLELVELRDDIRQLKSLIGVC